VIDQKPHDSSVSAGRHERSDGYLTERSDGEVPRAQQAGAVNRTHACLLSLSEMVARQRAAILARDALELNAICERLAQLEHDLLVEMAAVPSDTERCAGLASLARSLREQMGGNAALLANGMAIFDHFTGCVAKSSEAVSPLLLSGVA
jgi:hypothetical protein